MSVALERKEEKKKKERRKKQTKKTPTTATPTCDWNSTLFMMTLSHNMCILVIVTI